MRRFLRWIWRQGVLSTFLAGLFAILPLVITIVILVWVARYLEAVLGPTAAMGRLFRTVGLNFVSDEITAWVLGLLVVLVGVWFLGVLMKTVARQRVERAFDTVVGHIPVVKTVYRAAAQFVAMLRKKDHADLSGMSVVFCSFGQEHGGGFLSFLATPEVYRLDERQYHLVYVPNAPFMTGWLVFVPVEAVQRMDMTVEQVTRMYFSLGLLAGQVIPEQLRTPPPGMYPTAVPPGKGHS